MDQNRFFFFQFWHRGLLLRKAYFFPKELPKQFPPFSSRPFPSNFCFIGFFTTSFRQIVCLCIWNGEKIKTKLLLSERIKRTFLAFSHLERLMNRFFVCRKRLYLALWHLIFCSCCVFFLLFCKKPKDGGAELFRIFYIILV